jgi:hypothetical protein
MHLVHDFEHFSGETPTNLLTEVEKAHRAVIAIEPLAPESCRRASLDVVGFRETFRFASSRSMSPNRSPVRSVSRAL